MGRASAASVAFQASEACLQTVAYPEIVASEMEKMVVVLRVCLETVAFGKERTGVDQAAMSAPVLQAGSNNVVSEEVAMRES